MNRRINVRAIIINDKGEFFAVQQRHSGTKEPLPFWNTAGGGIDDGEDLITAFKREIVEELGVEPEVGRLLFIKQFMESEKDMEHLEFFFEVLNWQEYENIDLDKTTHGNEELIKFGFVDPKATKILPEFLKTQDYANLPDQVQIIAYNDYKDVTKL